MRSPVIISAVQTPFDDQDRIDIDAFAELLRGLPTGHATVLVAGTTGEFPALTDPERIAMFRSAVEVLGAEQVIAHVGSAGLRQSIGLAEAAVELGITTVALLTPYYLPAGEAQVVAHFASFAEALPQLRTFAYLFPDRTGVNLSAAAVADILALPSVAGLKLSGRANELLAGTDLGACAGQRVYSGDDRRALRIRAEGGDGVISGCFPVLPGSFAAALDPKSGDRADRQRRIDEIVDLLGPSIARQKCALQCRTGRPWRSRMSMPAVGDAVRAAITTLVERAGTDRAPA